MVCCWGDEVQYNQIILFQTIVETAASELPPLKDSPPVTDSQGRWTLWITNGPAEEEEEQYEDEIIDEEEMQRKEKEKGN